MRRLSWEPPEPATPAAVAAVLTSYGARPWQVELSAGPLAEALAAAAVGKVGETSGEEEEEV